MMVGTRQQTSPGRVIVLDVVGLQVEHLQRNIAPNLVALLPESQRANLHPSFPAVTVPVQTTLGTGQTPRHHGDIANGRYDREHDSVTFWGRARENRNRIWERASDDAGVTTGVLCFQHLIGTSADVALTPAPIEDEEDNIVEMNCWTNPDGWYDDLRADHGHFPLHNYWGPGANEKSSAWILAAARDAVEAYDPDLLWVYIPHLDYAGLRAGPGSDAMHEAVRTVDELIGDYLEFLKSTERWSETVVNMVSEYGFHSVDTPVYPNRILRDVGLLAVQGDGQGGADVDLAESRAFAMVDHQVAHIYIDNEFVNDVRQALDDVNGIECVLDQAGQSKRNIDNPNSGDLVCIAEPSAWFQYYWWTDPEDAPGYASDMDIHAKPGFDPCELFVGESGLISLDPTRVGGSHGRTDIAGFYGLGGPVAPSAVPQAVVAKAVAPTLVDLLDIGDDISMSFEAESILT